MAALDRVRALQACMPSYHVCWSLVLRSPPHFLNQEPPRPQQLLLPDLPMVPQLRHGDRLAVVVVAGVCVWALVQVTKRKVAKQSLHENTVTCYITLELTFAGLHALRPPVINVLVADTSTLLIPSTAGSATTGSARFLEGAALWTPHTDRRGDWSVGNKLAFMY